MKAITSKRKLLVGALLALVLVLGLGYVALAGSGGTVTVSFVHEGQPLAGGSLTLTAPDKIGDDHTFMYWRVDGQRRDGHTITIDMSSASTVEAVYNPGVTTIEVTDSDGNGLPNVSISYYNGYWRGLGTTGSDGKLTTDAVPDGTWTFNASYGGTSEQKSGDAGGTVQFQTAKATAHVSKSDDSDLQGAAISYYAGYWRGIGNTDSNGEASVELFPGTYNFQASYGGTSDTESLPLSRPGGTVEFQTSEATAHVAKSDDTDFPGVSISYYAGYWRGIGNTDSNGEASVELFPGTYNFNASYGGTSETQSLTLSSPGMVEFQTAKATAYVHDCDDNPISGASISYYAGYWRGIGNTGSDGKASVELFPTENLNFMASYGGTSDTESMDLDEDGETVEFTMTKVDLQYSGSMAYYAGYWRGFSGPIYMFPGTYTFKFDSTQTEIEVSGCELKGCVTIVRLQGANAGAYATIKYMEGQFEDGEVLILDCGVTIYAYGHDPSGTYTGGQVTHYVDGSDLVIPYCTFKVLLDGGNTGAYATIKYWPEEGKKFFNNDTVTLPKSATIYLYGHDPSGTYTGGQVTHHVDCSDVSIPYCTFKVLLDGGNTGAYATIKYWPEEGKKFFNNDTVTLPKSATIYLYGHDSSGTFTGGQVTHHVDCSDVSIPYCTLTFDWVGVPSSWPVRTYIKYYGDVPDGGSVTIPKSATIYFYGYIGDLGTNQYTEHVDCTWDTWTWDISTELDGGG